MSTSNAHAKLWDLIKDTRFGMLVHRHGDGLLHSHPLTTQNKATGRAGDALLLRARRTATSPATWPAIRS